MLSRAATRAAARHSPIAQLARRCCSTFQTSHTGLMMRDMTPLPPEDAVRPARGEEVEVNYVGRLEDGSVFDSTEQRGPFRFTLGRGQVIKVR